MEPFAAKAAVRKSAVTYRCARCIYCSPDRNPGISFFEITGRHHCAHCAVVKLPFTAHYQTYVARVRNGFVPATRRRVFARLRPLVRGGLSLRELTRNREGPLGNPLDR